MALAHHDVISAPPGLAFYQRGRECLAIEPVAFRWAVLAPEHRRALHGLRSPTTVAGAASRGIGPEVLDQLSGAGLLHVDGMDRRVGDVQQLCIARRDGNGHVARRVAGSRHGADSRHDLLFTIHEIELALDRREFLAGERKHALLDGHGKLR